MRATIEDIKLLPPANIKFTGERNTKFVMDLSRRILEGLEKKSSELNEIAKAENLDIREITPETIVMCLIRYYLDTDGWNVSVVRRGSLETVID